MKFKKSQSGRSMVEMLGVLAIIGVLSVGGIWGYSLSMRRHRANGVADYVSKFALGVYGRCHQKLLNGEMTDITECIHGKIADHYNDYDLGKLPAGVTNISFEEVSSDATSGVDTVIVSASFDDDKLCQAVGSVAGTGCDILSYGNIVLFHIKQN